MTKKIMRAMAATVLTLSVMGCGEGDKTAGEQIGTAVDKASNATLDAAEQAGDKIEQWTDRPGSDPRQKQQARKQPKPAGNQQGAKSP